LPHQAGVLIAADQLAIKTAATLLLRSRNDKDFTTRYRSIADALKKLPEETIIDGEVIAFD